MPTKKIYREAYRLLRRFSRSSAARYKLKRAIMELGPSGFPFEHYFSELLKSRGYEVTTGVWVEGYCVSHEIDVVAQKEGKRIMVECKFHNHQGYYSDVKVTLYIDARYRDILRKSQKHPDEIPTFHQCWIVTNTRFSEEGLKYAQCAGLYLLSWDYPAEDSLKKWIDVTGLYPITCLTVLNKREKQQLLDRGIVLAGDIPGKRTLLETLGWSPLTISRVLTEVQQLLQSGSGQK